jgi:hypothetical protein
MFTMGIDTGQINQLERKLNSDDTRFVLNFCCHWNPSAKCRMVGDNNNQAEVSLLFIVGCSTYLTQSKIGQNCASSFKNTNFEIPRILQIKVRRLLSA